MASHMNYSSTLHNANSNTFGLQKGKAKTRYKLSVHYLELEYFTLKGTALTMNYTCHWYHVASLLHLVIYFEEKMIMANQPNCDEKQLEETVAGAVVNCMGMFLVM
eukprot:1539546-Ditylum_brightwellii.AAC.1